MSAEKLLWMVQCTLHVDPIPFFRVSGEHVSFPPGSADFENRHIAVMFLLWKMRVLGLLN